MTPDMTEKIASILKRVKDPESGLSVEELGVIRRVRYNEEKEEMYIFADFVSHLPGCLTCVGIARAIISTILRDLKEEFQKEFPTLVIEFV
mgnify:CR=1 FL=1